jgi:hypothetical protein
VGESDNVNPNIPKSVVIPEKSLVERHVLSSKAQPLLRIERVVKSDTVTEYSAISDVMIDRDGITSIMTWPLDVIDADWRDVRSGLKDIAYPSRKIRKLAKAASLGIELGQVRHCARELAWVMDQNKDHHTYSANVPVLSYAEAHKRTTSDIISGNVYNELFDIFRSISADTITPELVDRITSMVDPVSLESFDSTELVRELTKFSKDELHQAQNLAVIDSVEQLQPGLFVELIERIKSQTFRQFNRSVGIHNGELVGGSYGQETYIYVDDVPHGVRFDIDIDRGTISDPRVHVTVGPTLRDKDRRTGLDRHKVEFHTRAPRVVAQPRLVWQSVRSESGDVTRTMMMPTSSREKPRSSDMVVRQPSAIIGAAVIACTLGQDIKLTPEAPPTAVEYAYELHRLYGNHGSRRQSHVHVPRSSAGMLPVVLTYQQEALMAQHSGYFEALEDRLQ